MKSPFRSTGLTNSIAILNQKCFLKYFWNCNTTNFACCWPLQTADSLQYSNLANELLNTSFHKSFFVTLTNLKISAYLLAIDSINTLFHECQAWVCVLIHLTSYLRKFFDIHCVLHQLWHGIIHRVLWCFLFMLLLKFFRFVGWE